jgi:hypothetical protein
MELETILEFQSYRRVTRLFLFACIVTCLGLLFCCIRLRSLVDSLDERVLLLEQQQKSMQDKSDADYDELDRQLNIIYSQVKQLQEQEAHNNKRIWL